MSQDVMEKGSKLREAVVEYGWKLRTRTLTMAGNITLLAKDFPVHFLDPGGAARTVTLPAEADSTDLAFVLVNTADALEAITVADDGTNTVVTIAQNEAALLVCNGTAWKGLVGANT